MSGLWVDGRMWQEKKKPIRHEAEMISTDHRDQAIKKPGLRKTINLLLVIPIKMVIVIRLWICMINAKG